MRPHLHAHARYDPKIPASTSARGPQQVRVVSAVGLHHPALSIHHRDSSYPVAAQAIRPSQQPPGSACQHALL